MFDARKRRCARGGVKIISNILLKEEHKVFPVMNGTMLIDLRCVG